MNSENVRQHETTEANCSYTRKSLVASITALCKTETYLKEPSPPCYASCPPSRWTILSSVNVIQSVSVVPPARTVFR